MRMSSVSYTPRKAIEVTALPKKSRKSERSVGIGEKESDEAITRCTPAIVCGATCT